MSAHGPQTQPVNEVFGLLIVRLQLFQPWVKQSELIVSPRSVVPILDPPRSPLSFSFSHYTIRGRVLSNRGLIGCQDPTCPF